MKHSVPIRNMKEVFQTTTIRGKINCIKLDSQSIGVQFSSAVFLDAATAILVLSGTGTIHINYKAYTMKADTLILLSASHLFGFDGCSDDFECLCLFVSKTFMYEMDSTDMIYRRIKYGVMLYNEPLVNLSGEHTALLAGRMAAVNRSIDDSAHLYHREIILNSLFAFYLDLSNIIDRQAGFCNGSHLSRYESIIKSFIELLASHYRKEHKVEFYSSHLNISAHYLTYIVKNITGQSVCDFIFEMLYSEARNLLGNSKLSVQEITTILNFSDQSSFGKFFKRKAGMSPADYRKDQS